MLPLCVHLLDLRCSVLCQDHCLRVQNIINIQLVRSEHLHGRNVGRAAGYISIRAFNNNQCLAGYLKVVKDFDEFLCLGSVKLQFVNNDELSCRNAVAQSG